MRKLTTEEFIKRANDKHGSKTYDYSLVKYTNSMEKVTIVCPKHGKFQQTPNDHINGGYGCSKCGYSRAGQKNKNNQSRSKKISQAKIQWSEEKKKSVQEKRENTNVEKYGVKNVRCADEVKQKIRETMDTPNSAGKTRRELQQDQARATIKQKYGVDNYFRLNDKIQEAFREKYGVSNPAHVAEFSQKSLYNSFKKKKYVFPSGREEFIQGFEDRALDALLDEGIHENDIVVSRTELPAIWYECSDTRRTRRYYPDAFIQTQNCIVEVKSKYTATQHAQNLEDKKRAVLNAGYEWKLMVFS
jgi:hypothetical protein